MRLHDLAQAALNARAYVVNLSIAARLEQQGVGANYVAHVGEITEGFDVAHSQHS